MIDYTTTTFIADLKRTGSVPTSQGLLDENDLLSFANDCMSRNLIPNIQKVREEYFVHRHIVEADGREYDLPERAIGTKLRQVQILDSDNKVLKNVQRLEPQIAEMGVDISSWSGVFGYFFEDNKIILTQDPSVTGRNVCMKFYRRPGKLVLPTVCAKVTDVSGADITVESVPNDMVIGSLIDMIQARPPFSSLGDSVEIINIAGNVITFAEETDLSIGDYLAPEGCSPIPQIPVELHPILVQYAKLQLMDATGDAAAFQRAAAQFKTLSDELFELIQDRDDGSPRKAVSANGLWVSAPTRFWRF